jgi:REP element-mobilizing transposase RayT
MLPHVWNLRSRRVFRVIGRALIEGADRFGMRICEYSVQGNHLHLLVEAEDGRALSHGMQGFIIRLARGLNRLMTRVGKVLADRYHARILRTPTEVVRALRYVRTNHAIHRQRWTRASTGASHSSGKPPQGQSFASLVDRYSSAARDHGIRLPRAQTFLLGRAVRAPTAIES